MCGSDWTQLKVQLDSHGRRLLFFDTQNANSWPTTRLEPYNILRPQMRCLQAQSTRSGKKANGTNAQEERTTQVKTTLYWGPGRLTGAESKQRADSFVLRCKSIPAVSSVLPHASFCFAAGNVLGAVSNGVCCACQHRDGFSYWLLLASPGS